MNVILFDTPQSHGNLLPLSYTRPVADFRVGILTIAEKWKRRLPGRYSYLPDESLRDLYPAERTGDNLYVNGALLPDSTLVAAIKELKPGEALYAGDELLALRGNRELFLDPATCPHKTYEGMPDMLRFVFDVFLLNAAQIEADFRLLTVGRRSAPISQTNLWIGNKRYADGLPRIFIEEGAHIEGATLNTTDGPIYIGTEAEVMEGSLIRGPFTLGEHSVVKMGAKIYTGTTIGPWCKVGGEVSNAVIFGYTNKAHDGFLGNAVIGQWCNIGAGTNASNLKNDYSKIRVWNYPRRTFMRTDLQFCGLIMGDHSRIGINGSLNTATVIGVGVNLHGTGFPRTFIPSFSKGSPTGGFRDLDMRTFLDMAERMMSRRGIAVTDHDRRLFEHVETQSRAFK